MEWLLYLQQVFLMSGILSGMGFSYQTTWNLSGMRTTSPPCVKIPQKLTLCSGIGYDQMRLPNLLGHDTMVEVAQQASHWVSLLNLKCHPDTQLFLCSLFSPVCLDRPIYPCRSLCEAVRQGCERRMNTYGYPWPDMVRCDQFPLDNDMCITVQSPVSDDKEPAPCVACNQPDTYENMIDNFCRADFVIKTRVRKLRNEELRFKKAKIFKMKEDVVTKADLKKPVFEHPNMSKCCGELIGKLDVRGRVLVMGIKKKNSLFPTLIIPWVNSNKVIRKARKTMKKFDCSNPKVFSSTMITTSKIPVQVGMKKKARRRRPGHRRGRKEIPNVRQGASVPCAGCNEPKTLENLVDKYCTAEYVIKTRIQRIKNDKMKCKRSRLVKLREGSTAREELVTPTFTHPNMTECCGNMLETMEDKKKRVVIMGEKSETYLKTSLVVPWGSNKKLIKRMIRVAKKKGCSSR
ncbi:secreted frizzled-related protein 5-like isoform X1 [Tachypleus tridentatus]|uniref:secreted frizzled-related protein 5-like isoform X1 n=1 Tax=Tachypleus tridentatus TaxID=6853 RepID=UPI003FD1C1ED